MITKNAPYLNQPVSEWETITKQLVSEHPLDTKELTEAVLESWEEIFRSKIGKKPFQIGIDIQPKPQIMGFFLHELIPLEFSRLYPGVWRPEKSANDKDMIYIPNDYYSLEIKTSSNPNSIFGNRSYAQEGDSKKKTKSGFYLAINFEKFNETNYHPKILKIRFGWLDHTDWLGQTAATGQQARLTRAVEDNKLLQLYPSKIKQASLNIS